jgi:hypothetical protein
MAPQHNTEYVVLWIRKGYSLLLSDIVRDATGRIKSAWVVNGLWNLRITDGVGEAWGPDSMVTSGIDMSEAVEVPVLDSVRGGHNEIIASRGMTT